MKKALITGITGQDGSYLTELLLEKGADVNAKDKYGKTPLDVAHTNEIKKLLLDNGAKYGNELK